MRYAELPTLLGAVTVTKKSWPAPLALMFKVLPLEGALPTQLKGDSVETVYGVSLDNPYNIDSAPVSDDVAEWLKELAAAKVKLNNEGLYVIFEDFELKKDPKNKNMHIAKLNTD